MGAKTTAGSMTAEPMKNRWGNRKGSFYRKNGGSKGTPWREPPDHGRASE
jgi:hypothetical protein